MGQIIQTGVGVTFTNKVDRQVQPGSRINLVVADDINQLKDGVQGLIAFLNAYMTVRTAIPLTAANFSGQNYQNSILTGLTPDVDFFVYTDEGSGTLLQYDPTGYDPEGGYQFNATTGTLTMPPQGYRLVVFQRVNIS